MIRKFVIALLLNSVVLWLAGKYIVGFNAPRALLDLIILGAALAILNLLLKPVLKLILGPLIIITLGAGVILVNAAILWGLSFLSARLDFLPHGFSIDSIPALLLGTIVLSAANILQSMLSSKNQ